MNPKRPTSRCVIIKMAKIKDKKRIIKVAREKQLYTRGNPRDYLLIFQQKLFRPLESGII